MRQHSAPWLVAGIAAFAIAAACEREAPRDAELTRDTAAPADTTRTDLNDGWITTKVQAKFFVDRDVKGRNIDISTNNGIVTLTGTVEDEAERQQALSIARDTEGVVRVEDRLSVQAVATTGITPAPADEPAPTDRPAAEADRPAPDRDVTERAEDTARETGDQVSSAWITTKIQAQYFTDTDVRGRRIDVTTNNGIVTLTGSVESDAERQRAVEIAQATEGVRRVEDQLQVVGTAGEMAERDEAVEERAEADPDDRGIRERMSDAGITTRIQSKFFLDDTVKLRNIDVTTESGIVTLQGEVQSELEQQRAVALARSVDGVADVQSRLQVNPQLERDTAAATTGEADRPAEGTAGRIDDAWITTKIQSKYFVDDLVKTGDVSVDTNNGVVTLTGTVPSRDARERAEALASQTSGVTRVDNQLTVGTEETTTSAARD